MAMAGAARGYRVICIVDPKLTDVIEAMLVALGAEIRFADQADETGSYLKHRLRIRDELLQSIPGAWCPGQYTNPKSIEAHATTGREIADALGGRLDYLVIPTGTGATVTGAGRAAKDAIPGLTVVAVDADHRSSTATCSPGSRRASDPVCVPTSSTTWTPPS